MALLEFLDSKLIPAMKEYDYEVSVVPFDLILGMAGAQSSFTKLFEEVAEEENVPLYQLILETSKINRKDPDKELMKEVAQTLK